MSSRKLSLWCLWNFVNMVYWQLREMHFPDSPLNQICMPIKQSEEKEIISKKESEEAKQFVKGEIIQFMLRTAQEFVTRKNIGITDGEEIGLNVTGFSNRNWNGKWNKRIFEHDGKPVYTISIKNVSFNMYYRSNLGQWVIDDVIVMIGGVYSKSSSDNIFTCDWKTVSQWETDPSIKCEKIKGRHDADMGEAYEITGNTQERTLTNFY
jgi:hypothetical protein